MAYGLQVFRSDGVLILDITSRLTRYVEAISVYLSNSGKDIYVTGMTTDGTWVAVASNTFVNVKIYNGYFNAYLPNRTATFTVSVIRV